MSLTRQVNVGDLLISGINTKNDFAFIRQYDIILSARLHFYLCVTESKGPESCDIIFLSAQSRELPSQKKEIHN